MVLSKPLSMYLLISIFLAPSCIRFTGPEDVRRDLGDQAGVQLKQETGFTVTRSGMWLARKFVKDEDVPLEGVRRVEIGVYEVKGLRKGSEEPARLDLGHLKGWEPIVRVREDDEQVFVLIKQEEQLIRGLLVVVAEQDEWVLVRLRGKLNQVFERSMEMVFADMNRPDLYAMTRRERGLDPEPEPTEFEFTYTAAGHGTCIESDDLRKLINERP